MKNLFKTLFTFALVVGISIGFLASNYKKAEAAPVSSYLLPLPSNFPGTGTLATTIKATYFNAASNGVIHGGTTSVQVTLDKDFNTTVGNHDVEVELYVSYPGLFATNTLRTAQLYRDFSSESVKTVNFSTDPNPIILFQYVPLASNTDIYCVLKDKVTGDRAYCNGSSGVPLQITNPTSLKPVFRFWSGAFQAHFFTLNPSMVTNTNLMKYWDFEGIAYYAHSYVTNDGNGQLTKPVYRFWSPVFQAHFFTLDDSMKNNPTLMQYWEYEGAVFYAYETDPAVADVPNKAPVYRFWSPVFKAHFFTLDDSMKNNPTLMQYWEYEGIAFWGAEMKGAF